MNYRNFVGIDMSKLWFDAYFIKVDTPKVGIYERFTNDDEGIASFVAWLSNNAKDELSSTLAVMEHTGVYTIPLCKCLGEKEISYTLIAGVEILKSLGLTRGASDKIDSMRIAKYAYKNREEIRICTLPIKLIAQLKRMLTFREQLVRQLGAIKVSAKETQDYNVLIDNQFIVESVAAITDLYKQRIDIIEDEMIALIKSDDNLLRNYTLLLSVPGIGFVNAVAFLVYTECFVRFTDPRKYASYCGIAPFANGSGKSPGKAKVSHFANKRVKALLVSGAWSAVRFNAEMSIYFNRQLKKGKERASIINVISNKLVHIVFAIIRKGCPYENRHTFHTVAV